MLLMCSRDASECADIFGVYFDHSIEFGDIAACFGHLFCRFLQLAVDGHDEIGVKFEGCSGLLGHGFKAFFERR